MSSACMYAPTPLRSNSLHTTHGRRYSFTRAVSDGWVWNTSAAAGDTGARDMAGAEGREEVGGRWVIRWLSTRRPAREWGARRGAGAGQL
jgi:hypothetical protein